MEGWLGPVVVAAAISSLVTMAGWWLNHRNELRRNAANRAERIRDVQAALRAEIRSHRERLRLFEATPENIVLLERIAQSSEAAPFTPFLPREVDSFIFDAVIEEIHVLPVRVIDDVVIYYRQTRALAQFADDLRSERYERLQPSRKADMFRDYLELGRYAGQLADRAHDAIDAALAQTSGSGVNKPGADPSDPRSGAAPGARGADGRSSP